MCIVGSCQESKWLHIAGLGLISLRYNELIIGWRLILLWAFPPFWAHHFELTIMSPLGSLYLWVLLPYQFKDISMNSLNYLLWNDDLPLCVAPGFEFEFDFEFEPLWCHNHSVTREMHVLLNHRNVTWEDVGWINYCIDIKHILQAWCHW